MILIHCISNILFLTDDKGVSHRFARVSEGDTRPDFSSIGYFYTLLLLDIDLVF